MFKQTLIVPNVRDPNPKKTLYSFNPGKTNKIRYQSTSCFLSLSFEKIIIRRKTLLLKKRTINPEIPRPTRLKSLKDFHPKKWEFFIPVRSPILFIQTLVVNRQIFQILI